MKKFKITIKVQSVSDIITNSSSETFMRIGSYDKDLHEQIFKCLESLLPSKDWDLSPGVHCANGDETDKYAYYVDVSMPYGVEMDTFMEAGIRAILKEAFGENGYEIDVCW